MIENLAPCAGCNFYKKKRFGLKTFYGCIRREVDPFTYVKLAMMGGVCEHRQDVPA